MDAAESVDKVRENRVRRRAQRLGFGLRRSRARFLHLNSQGGYRIVDLASDATVAGERYDLSLDDVEAHLDVAERRVGPDARRYSPMNETQQQRFTREATAALGRLGFVIRERQPTDAGVRLEIARPAGLDPADWPEVSVSEAVGSDELDALRNALSDIADETTTATLQLGWSCGTSMRSSYGLMLKLRPWPDTWGPGSHEVFGESTPEAWLAAWRYAKENPVAMSA